ncbi:MAG TPA: hypothetical protein PKA28_19730, partial [Methylomusa anaerophila]
YWLFDATLPAKSEDRPQQENTCLSPQSNVQFDVTFYDKLIDEIMNDIISIDVAVQKAKNVFAI